MVCAVAIVASAAPAAQAETRYSLAGGCFTLTSATGQAAPGAGKLRMQATRLGSYMLYGPSADFIAVLGGNTVGHTTPPSPAADWKVEDSSGGSFTLSPASAPDELLAFSGATLTVVPRQGAGAETHFSFSPTDGCAVFPEAELNVTGTPAKGSTSYGEVRGFIDGHMHWMTFEYLGGNFHCGKPWSPYGIPDALPDCSSTEGPLGVAAPFQNFLNFGNPVMPHSTAGWPTMAETGAHNLTTEGTYWRWLERVWADGLRLIVMPINENRMLCQLQANRKTNCDEMDTVYRGLDDMYALQDYVDAQAGGPGKGFFRIVKNPIEARHVINEGKMAVVLEVEVSEPFGCIGADPSSCNKQKIDASLNKLYDRGVRSSLLLNKFDNPLTGVRFDSGALGAVINAGNLVSDGSFWSANSCQGPHDNNIDYPGASDPTGFIASQITNLGVAPGTVPSYPAPPNCNTRGLTDLGAHTVEQMMNKHMIVNPDHMSQLAVDKTISLAEARHYSGVISPHGWMDPRNWPRIYNLGGMAFPSASGSARNFVDEWRKYRPQNPPYYLGWGYGADLGGLAQQPNPEPPGSPATVTYPFKSLDGSTTVYRQRTGNRTFDYPTEGVAHYGLYADFLEEVRKLGGPAIQQDMLHGAETYLEMWERAYGIPSGKCLSARKKFSKHGLEKLRLGLSADDLLVHAGQPLQRTRAWSYCVNGKRNLHKKATAVLTPGGSVALVASNAPGHRARGIGPGSRAGLLEGHAKRIGKGIWVARLGKRRLAYVVHKGRVRTVAVASKSLRGSKALVEYLKLIPSGALTRRPRKLPVDKSVIPVTPKNALPLRMQQAADQISFVCGMAAQAAPPPASPFAPPL
jgi:microsomal dipeptidase-like Zn-dependent dipeptidase